MLNYFSIHGRAHTWPADSCRLSAASALDPENEFRVTRWGPIERLPPPERRPRPAIVLRRKPERWPRDGRSRNAPAFAGARLVLPTLRPSPEHMVASPAGTASS